MKSGNLNFLEPSGPLQACNGTDLSFSLEVPPIFQVLCKLMSFTWRQNTLRISRKDRLSWAKALLLGCRNLVLLIVRAYLLAVFALHVSDHIHQATTPDGRITGRFRFAVPQHGHYLMSLFLEPRARKRGLNVKKNLRVLYNCLSCSKRKKICYVFIHISTIIKDFLL